MNTSKSTLTEEALHLYNEAANSLPSSPSMNILKSYYFTKCRTLAIAGSFTLPQQFTKTTLRCPKCNVQYKDAGATYHLKSKPKQSKSVRKLLKKCKNESNMTSYGRKLLKNRTCKEDAMTHNILVITCGLCKNKTNKNLKKPKQSLTSSIEVQDQSIIKRLRKKKKRDRFSGLNQEAVLSASSTPKKSRKMSGLLPLEVTPKANKSSQKSKKADKTNLSPNPKKIEKIKKTKSNRQQKKNKEKKMKGLQNILNNSKAKSSPSAALQQFLSSI